MNKRILSLFLALIMLLLALCACAQEEADTDQPTDTDAQTTVELSYTEENGILLSGDHHYRIVYSKDVTPLTITNLRNRLNVLDEAENVTYDAFLDTEAEDDGTPEILIGLTNRALSQEAQELLESALDYAIIISEGKIAIYAHTPAALSQAVTYFRSALVVNEIGQVFYNQKENYVKKVTYFPAADLKIDGVSIDKFTLIVSKNADADTLAAADGIATLLMEKTGAFLTVKDDARAATANEILIGSTNRTESKDITNEPVDVNGDYRVSVANGKLAIAACGKEGYSSANNYISKVLAAPEKEITSNHSINSLSLAQIESVTFGAAFMENAKDGLHFYKCTQAQMKQWATYGNANATYSTGVCLDFYTDSPFFGFRITPDSGTKFELYVNGQYVKTLTAVKHTNIREELDTTKGENRVTLIFPSYSAGALSSVLLAKGATLKPYTYTRSILFMGDSITHGHGCSQDSHSYAQLTARHFDAEAIIQGVGGGAFDAKTIDPQLDFDPDNIIVAFGCNDWNRNKNDEQGFRAKLTAFMDKLKTTYPNANVIFITPIPRLDFANTSKTYDMSLEETRAIIAEESAKRGWHSVSGTDMLPADRQYYGDDLHPNIKGYELYAENLCKAIKNIIR